MIKKRVKLRFVGRTADGKLVKGAPGNYEMGEITLGPLIWAQVHPKIWELVEPDPNLNTPNIFESDNVFEERKIIERVKQSPPSHKTAFIESAIPEIPIKRDGERVAVSVLTLMRPYFLEPCLESILTNITPLKIVITNQADYGEEHMRILNKWKTKPFVHYRVNDPRKWPGPSRAEVFELLAEAGYEYVITLDDDCKLLPFAIDKLVKAADEHPEFHAISGYLMTPGKGVDRKYMMGGKKVYHGDKNKWIYKNFDWSPGVRETDYICNGFRLIRLNPLVLPDREFTIGLTDFDWSANAKSRGLRLAVCGEAGAYHKFLWVDGKKTTVINSVPYNKIRRDRIEIQRMKERFAIKWGYRI